MREVVGTNTQMQATNFRTFVTSFSFTYIKALDLDRRDKKSQKIHIR